MVLDQNYPSPHWHYHTSAVLYACERMHWVKIQHYLQQQCCVYEELSCHGLTASSTLIGVLQVGHNNGLKLNIASRMFFPCK